MAQKPVVPIRFWRGILVSELGRMQFEQHPGRKGKRGFDRIKLTGTEYHAPKRRRFGWLLVRSALGVMAFARAGRSFVRIKDGRVFSRSACEKQPHIASGSRQINPKRQKASGLVKGHGKTGRAGGKTSAKDMTGGLPGVWKGSVSQPAAVFGAGGSPPAGGIRATGGEYAAKKGVRYERRKKVRAGFVPGAV